MFKMNLQFFSEEEDMILPDDFEDTPTEEPTEEVEETPEETEETIEETIEESAEDTTPTEPQKIMIPIKFNKEEREVTVEEAAVLAQKGLNYDKAVERARQEARDAWIAEQGYEWQGKPITTEAEYKQALQEKELMEKYQDVPEELRQEIIENRRFREQYQSQQQQQEQSQKEQQQYQEFLAAFPDVDPQIIKPETWDKVSQGIPLKYAYMEQEREELLTKVKITQQNEQNRQKGMSGVTSHGEETTTSDPFLEGFDSVL